MSFVFPWLRCTTLLSALCLAAPFAATAAAGDPPTSLLHPLSTSLSASVPMQLLFRTLTPLTRKNQLELEQRTGRSSEAGRTAKLLGGSVTFSDGAHLTFARVPLTRIPANATPVDVWEGGLTLMIVVTANQIRVLGSSHQEVLGGPLTVPLPVGATISCAVNIDGEYADREAFAYSATGKLVAAASSPISASQAQAAQTTLQRALTTVRRKSNTPYTFDENNYLCYTRNVPGLGVLFKGQQHGDGWEYQQFYAVNLDAGQRPVSVETWTVGGCIPLDARLTGEHGALLARDIVPGTRLWTWDVDARSRRLTTVLAVYRPLVRGMWEINQRLRVSPEHPLLRQGTWVESDHCQIGDLIKSEDGSDVAITSKRWLPGPIGAVDLSVDGHHTFIVEGYLSHNKKPTHFSDMNDLWFLYFPIPNKVVRLWPIPK